MKPLARHLDLICTDQGGDLIVHDTRRQETHRLSPLMAVVYRHADGRTSLTEMVALARAQLRRAVSKEMIISALDQLSDVDLLAPPERLAEAAAQAAN